MDFTTISCVFIICILIGFIGFRLEKCLRDYIDTWFALKNDRNDIDRIIFLADYDFQKSLDLVDNIIQSGITEYRIHNFDYLQERNNDYIINSKEIKKMIDFLIKYTIKRITPSVEALLDLYVNFESEQELLSFVGERVNLFVLEYTTRMNQQQPT